MELPRLTSCYAARSDGDTRPRQRVRLTATTLAPHVMCFDAPTGTRHIAMKRLDLRVENFFWICLPQHFSFSGPYAWWAYSHSHG